ncbi:hypothetical protein [Paenibacillus hamazuiensis]|uniref:hypothetical protein n=1 Tax=Paenibacillus hamazuiensis TaxID=2936508 RepID=UPI00200F50DC|nr:hypothetical protein [Paenibacillus hamazuiensis]
MALAINFVAINVNSINRDATLAVGENNQPGWSTHGKTMFGNMQSFGLSFVTNIVNNMIDSDVVDSPIVDNDSIPSAQNQIA